MCHMTLDEKDDAFRDHHLIGLLHAVQGLSNLFSREVQLAAAGAGLRGADVGCDGLQRQRLRVLGLKEVEQGGLELREPGRSEGETGTCEG